jgi:hypothetical protein
VRQQQRRQSSSSIVRSAVQPILESLEKRRLLSASVVLNNINSPALGPADTTGVQQRPVVSFKGSTGVMAWTDSNASGGSGVDIVARRFNASGDWSSDPFTANTTTGGDQASPAVAVADDGSFVIAWADGNNVRARRFDTAGSAVGNNFTVSTDSTNAKSNVAVAMAGDGRFIVSWTSAGQDTAGLGIYGQRFAANGSTAGSEFPVNTTTTGDQDRSTVAMDDSGNFVVAWQGPDAAGNGIWMQAYDNTGAAQGGETGVNTTTADEQTSPSVAASGSGAFVVGWTSNAQDGSGQGVYFQRYNNTAAAQGSETVVNTTTTGDQQLPSVGMNDSGAFVISFVDTSTTPDRNLARVFGSNGVAMSAESTVATSADSATVPSVATITDSKFVVTAMNNDSGTNDVFATVFHGMLTVAGGNSGSTISVTASSGQVVVNVDGSPTTLDPAFDAVSIAGGTGNDSITVATGLPAGVTSVSIDGGAGDDHISGGDVAMTVTAGDGNDTVDGSSAPDSITGGDGNDSITGAAGDDRIDPGAGDDNVAGGADTDTLTYQSRSENLTVRIDGGGASGATGENDTIASDFENAVGGAGNDLVIGNGSDNIIGGDVGNDTLQAGAGNDTVFGDAGNDVIDPGIGTDSVSGGNGIDTVSYSTRTAGVHINLDGTASSGETAENDTVSNDVENATGGNGGDVITGNNGDNTFNGGAGNDTMIGLAGNDTINGGAGNDSATGGDGNDRFVMGDGNDTVDGGFGPDVMYGQGGNDSLFGSVGRDRIIAGEGNDRVKGGSHNDTINGENGRDTLYGDGGNDIIDAGNHDDYEFGGTGNDILFGVGGNDKLFGESGNDTLNGGIGSDRLDGGTGIDQAFRDGLDGLFSCEQIG